MGGCQSTESVAEPTCTAETSVSATSATPSSLEEHLMQLKSKPSKPSTAATEDEFDDPSILSEYTGSSLTTRRSHLLHSCDGGSSRVLQFSLGILANKAEVARYNAMAEHAIKESRDYGAALNYYQLALAQIEKTNEMADKATAYHNVGTMYQMLGKYEEALANHENEIEIRQNIAFNPIALSENLKSLGQAHAGLGDNRRALKFYSQGLQVIEKFEPDTSEHALLLCDIARIQFQERMFEPALNLCDEALRIQRSKDPASEETASIVMFIGMILCRQGRFADAEKYFQVALKIYRTVKPASLEISSVLRSLGQIYRRDPTRLDEAIDCYALALEINAKEFPNSESTVAIRRILRELRTRSGKALDEQRAMVDV